MCFFGRLAGLPSGDVPYPIFAFCALLPWQLFAYALVHSSNSLVENAQTIKKVYFPRLIVPLASVITGLVDFAIASLVLVVLMVYYRIVPGWAGRDLAFVHAACGDCGAGGRAVALGLEREIPGCPIRDSVPGSVLAAS